MNFTTRAFPAPVIALVFALVLVACGDGEESASPTASGTASGSATASPTAEPSESPSLTADESPSVDAPEGFVRIAVAQGGFSVAVPDDWEELSPDVIADSGVMDDMRESNPDAATALEQAQAAIEAGQIALFAFDAANVNSGFATNLNVINVGPVSDTAEEAAEDVALAITEQVPVTGEVETETTVLPSGDAALVRYEWEIADPDGAVTAVTVVQYAIIADSGTGFILSMSVATDSIAEYEETFRQIAESFREEPA